MDTVQILVLALVQGITEFLPISSSGHLVLTPLLFGYHLQSLAFDVAVHLGTLGAVMLYFRRELKGLIRALFHSMYSRRVDTPQARLAWMLLLATVPVLILGLPMKNLLEFLRGNEVLLAQVVATTSIGFGILLWVADLFARRQHNEYAVGWRGALFIGTLQAISIVPGTSRSGVTITAARMLGLTRKGASRFSFLLSIPTILMAGGMETIDLLESTEPVDWISLLIGATWSFVFAYITIYLFLRFIERVSMLPFVLYRVALGALIFWLI